MTAPSTTSSTVGSQIPFDNISPADAKGLVDRSRREPVPEASGVIGLLSQKLDSLIKEYRVLQAAEASSAREQRITDLFLRYNYPMLRDCFRRLSHLSATHCYDNKQKCLSHLMRCLEIDPIISQSRDGLGELLNDLVSHLERIFPNSSSTTTWAFSSLAEDELNIARSLLQVLTRLLEAWAWHTEKLPSLFLEDALTKRTRSILEAIGNHPAFSKDEEESNYRARDIKLHHEIAQIALNHLSADHAALKALFAVVSPLVEAVQKQNDTVQVMGQLFFQTIAKAHKDYKGKEWYVNLFAMRQATRHITDHSDRLRFLQASLLQRRRGFSWQFAGGVLHMMGMLGLDCQDPELRKYICYGQKTSKESAHLPGLMDIQGQEFRVYQPILDSDSTYKNQLAYLAQLAKAHWESIVNFVPVTTSNTSPTQAKEKEGSPPVAASPINSKELEEIGKKIGRLIDSSKKGGGYEVPEVVSKLFSQLLHLITEYRALQAAKASPEREMCISALFSNCQFRILRNYFWELSHLSAKYCYENKLQCLSYLRECLENDPIILQSREGLIELVKNIADHFGMTFPSVPSQSTSTALSSLKITYSNNLIHEKELNIAKELLRVLKLISEVWGWHKEKLPIMAIEESVINKMQKALEIIGGRYAATEGQAYNRAEWDLRLNYEIAQVAIKHFSADGYDVKALFDIASPLVECANALRFKQNTVNVMTQLFREVARAYHSSSAKSRYEMWYVRLFSIRKAVRAIPAYSDKVRFLQASLLILTECHISWQLAGGILEIIGKLGRQSKNQKLRYDICIGQKNSENSEGYLPGLIHFYSKEINVYRSPKDKEPYSKDANPVMHLAELAQHYADMIIDGLQSGKEKDELKKKFEIESTSRNRQQDLSEFSAWSGREPYLW